MVGFDILLSPYIYIYYFLIIITIFFLSASNWKAIRYVIIMMSFNEFPTQTNQIKCLQTSFTIFLFYFYFFFPVLISFFVNWRNYPSQLFFFSSFKVYMPLVRSIFISNLTYKRWEITSLQDTQKCFNSSSFFRVIWSQYTTHNKY